MMAASTSNVSNPSSLARLSDLEMLQELIIMSDMVQELNEDREKTILQEDLMAMKEDKK